MYLALPGAIASLLLVVALSAARPDRPPIGWLLARPDREALLRLYGLAVGYPIVVALLRVTFLALGRSERAAFALSVLVCTGLAAVIGFRLRRGEQDLLIEKEQLARERAEAEMRYRMYADNAVDIIIHLRDIKVVWVSPSVEPALGGPAQRWLDVGFQPLRPSRRSRRALAIALKRIAGGESVQERFRVCSIEGEYHWVDGHGKPHVDAEGNPDGLIAALRIVDDRVAVEQQLEKLARFDTLTGLANRGEAIARLEAALEHPPAFGVHIGIIFCDVDHFKEINDTWGHGIGDTVLATLASRIRESVRPGTPSVAPGRRDDRRAARRPQHRRTRPHQRGDPFPRSPTHPRGGQDDQRDPEHRRHRRRSRRDRVLGHGPRRRRDVPGQARCQEHRCPGGAGAGSPSGAGV